MASNNNILGLIFANMHDDTIEELTKTRTTGSVMFGGRYRLIDFPLSNMVNSGINEVGVITKRNYQSLMDHLGSGKEWDLSGKNGGLKLFPPYGRNESVLYSGRLEALKGIVGYIENTNADYVIMSDCDVPMTIDYKPIVKAHIEKGADITAVYCNSEFYNTGTIFSMNEDGRIIDVMINPEISGHCNISLNTFILKKSFLVQIIKEASSRGAVSFERTVLQDGKDTYKIYGYEFNGYCTRINDIDSYYKANMKLLDRNNRNALFTTNKPIYTKIKDNCPTKFGLDSKVKNSLIADGCIIEGTVENSVLFRGVKIGKNTVIKDSIIMQDTVIGNDCSMSCIIVDKDVNISDGKILSASKTKPFFIAKKTNI
ncbi:MAG: glucose-1-phosphate adenylyltransferase subunit GlgD [Oscillospiraceae bacterium]